MPQQQLRVRVFAVAVVFVTVLFLARAAQLQLVDTEIYTGTSRKNSIHTRLVDPARGIVYDRNGQLLVDNEPTYTIRLTPIFFDTTKTKLLADLLAVSPQKVRERLQKAREWSPYKPSRSFREVPDTIFARIQENFYRLPGVDYTVDEKRRYHRALAPHALGYVKEISGPQLSRLKDQGYRMGDRIGKAGIEKAYDHILRGERGREFKLVNVHGQEVGSYRGGQENIPPQSGPDLYLSLDADLQAMAESLFVNKIGAAIALDPRNGEILSMVSSPDYDPSLLAGEIDSKVWQMLQTNVHDPLFNRAALSAQPPGSTFKPFMALVGLEEGVITEDSQIYCPGYYTYRGHVYQCHGDPHGSITVKDAITESCNTFFFTIMMRLNFQRWYEWGTKFGFGQRVPTDLPKQSRGVFPDSSYFDRTYGESGWTRGYLVSLGIGQGNFTATPLQLARYAGALANRGTLYPPHLVKKVVDPQTGQARAPNLSAPTKLDLKPKHLQVVRKGMRNLVMEKDVFLRWRGVEAAGKTGTAQNPRGEDHAWFIGFAPYDNPKIAVAVLVEHGGFGATVSAPLAGLMIEKYLTGEIAGNREWVYEYVRKRKSKIESILSKASSEDEE